MANTVTFVSEFIDEHGNSVKRTKYEYPYSYDAFVTYRGGKNDEATGTVYSDRLLQWDYNKARDLMRKHFGNTSDYYDSRSPKSIEAFLSDYMDKNIELILIMEGCNQANGYPVWRFDYKEETS